jgi:hypothetical protein
MQNYLDIFNALKAERSAEFQAQHGLTIKSGEGHGAVILKLLKPTWTTDAADEFLNSNGLFFSVWVDAPCEAKGIARYNLHAKKLRFIKGERFEARQFVRTFRAAVDLRDWPNVSFPKGPITLFEGHVALDARTLHQETATLIDRFAKMVPMLEQVLGE